MDFLRIGFLFGFIPTPGLLLLIFTTISIILIPFRLRERGERLEFSDMFTEHDWLSSKSKSNIPPSEFEAAKQRGHSLSDQECFDLAVSSSEILKGVLAHPTVFKLKKLDAFLHNDCNLSKQFQSDLAKNLGYIYSRYQLELAGLIEAILAQSENPIVLAAVNNLTLGQDIENARLKSVSNAIIESPSMADIL